MKKLKELYSSPTTDFFEVRFEVNIMSPEWGAKNEPGEIEDEEDEDIYEL